MTRKFVFEIERGFIIHNLMNISLGDGPEHVKIGPKIPKSDVVRDLDEEHLDNTSRMNGEL